MVKYIAFTPNPHWKVLSNGTEYIGICDTLKLCVYASDMEALKQSAFEAIKLICEDINDAQELRNFMESHGHHIDIYDTDPFHQLSIETSLKFVSAFDTPEVFEVTHA